MDFVMAFVVYIFALSVFFFALRNVSALKADHELDVQGELLFARLDETIDAQYDFLGGARVDGEKLDQYIHDLTPIAPMSFSGIYNYTFRDFELPEKFSRIDFCIYLEKKIDDDNYEITRNFAASTADPADLHILIDSSNDICGIDAFTSIIYNPAVLVFPRCVDNEKTESLVVAKPVVYDGQIYNLKILVCALRND